ncbi:hypothetical protein TNIN_77561 [Trichonephila inaurata madagascariensis]|uniref:Uncharacterized protein n=1 Tax=Trichonephila inaurata madagascariensis TaxID=2747483 RepID=A0A8X6WU06_9ARAC|nr:hypothetical protein TNIN_77561 [Trichonephila inaurata madagascariensis]
MGVFTAHACGRVYSRMQEKSVSSSRILDIALGTGQSLGNRGFGQEESYITESDIREDKRATYMYTKSEILSIAAHKGKDSCKDLLLAPGNRSNDTHEIWQRAHYIEEDLATTGETRPEEIERGEREKERREKRGRRKEEGWTMDCYLIPS